MSLVLRKPEKLENWCQATANPPGLLELERPVMSASNKDVLTKANAAIVEGDYEGFLKFCTENTRWTFVGDKTLEGKEAVRQWMADNYKEPPTFEVSRLIAGEDHVTALGEITLKNESGTPVRHAYSDVWRFKDGKMVELHAFVIPGSLDKSKGS